MDGITVCTVFLIFVSQMDEIKGNAHSDGGEPLYHPRHHHIRSAARTQNDDVDWHERGQQELVTSLKALPKMKPAKNAILFVGDGMGISTLTAARIFKAQKKGYSVPDTYLSWEKFPWTGLIKTYNTDQQTADSAGTATAFVTGEKARAGVIGVNQKVPRGNCSMVAGNELKSFIRIGMDEGKWAGVISTTRITHATPAATYAHSPERDWEDDSVVPEADRDTCWDIGRQLVHLRHNRNLRVILGGGRRHMMPNTMSDPEYPDKKGQRLDGRDLRQEWLDVHRDMGLANDDCVYVENKTDFNKVDTSRVEHLMGLFEWNNMKYDTERLEETGDTWTEPSISEMIKKAIEILKRGPKGFVLLVEGGRIDHAHHDTNAYRALQDTLALEEAVAVAVRETSEEDTLIAVTADHSHVFTIGGYQELNADILGIVGRGGKESRADDNKPWLTLSYANGPGYYYHRTEGGNINNMAPRRNLSGITTNGKGFLQDAAVPRDSETHGGEDVAVYARGPMAHLFTGQHEQSYIAHAIMYTACIGWNKDLCNAPPKQPMCTTAGAAIYRGQFVLIIFFTLIVTV